MNQNKRKVTIQDIAEALGLSRNTVSKAINNTGGLADATREKILKKAAEMGYKQFSYFPMMMEGAREGGQEAGEMAEPEKNGIALFTTFFMGNSHFSSTMLDCLQQQIGKRGYSLSMHLVSKDDLQRKTLPASYRPEQTAGIICFEIFEPEYCQMLADMEIPLLLVDTPAIPCCEGKIRADALYMESREHIFSFVREMARRGKTRIGFVGEPLHCQSFYERYCGYREALRYLGLPDGEKYCILGNPKDLPEEAGIDKGDYRGYVAYMLERMEELPDVFICSNDFSAMDILLACKKLGISVPEDVCLCGFDDAPEASVLTPALTTVHIHSQSMGVLAAAMLLSRIHEPASYYYAVHTESSLVYRESTGDFL